MPCGPVRVYTMNSNNIFTGDRQEQSPFSDAKTCQSEEAMEWLFWLESARKSGTFRHALTLQGEAKVGPRQIPVDGFDSTDGTIYQYHGCWTHSCQCKRPPRAKKERFTQWCARRFHSDKMDAYMRSFAPGKLIIMYACEWQKLKNNDPVIRHKVQSLVREKSFHPPLLTFKSNTAESMTREVSKLVVDEVLFGMIMVDMEVPKHLREYYKDMQVTSVLRRVCFISLMRSTLMGQ